MRISLRPAYIPGWDIKTISNFGMSAMFIPKAWGWTRAWEAAWEVSVVLSPNNYR